MEEGTDAAPCQTVAGIPRDPWQSRAKGMLCRTCISYVEKKGIVGRCRRHAPSMNGYPVVFNHDWCGDHKLDEDKI